jgi:hypothetical protein
MPVEDLETDVPRLFLDKISINYTI